jgi:hypothetical protein
LAKDKMPRRRRPPAPEAIMQRLDQVDDLLEGRHRRAPVEAGPAKLRQALHGPQGPELGQREVLGELAGHGNAVDLLGGPPVSKLRVAGDVGGGGDLVPGRATSTPSLVDTISGST